MDTISHFAMGAGIATITTINPEIAQSDNLPFYFAAVIAAANLPDIDVITRVLGAKKFLLLHRGPTHSLIVALPLALLLAWLFRGFVGDINPVHFMAVIVASTASHLVMDLMNNYGVSLGIPIISKWYRLSITNTADAVVWTTHFIGLPLFAWLWFTNNTSSWMVFVIIYIMLGTYLLFAATYKLLAEYIVKHNYSNVKGYESTYILSKSMPWRWKYIVTFKDKYIIGNLNGKTISEIRDVKRVDNVDDKTMDIIKKDPAWKYFSKFSPLYTIKKTKQEKKDVVFLRDLRYFNNAGKFSFVVNIAYNSKGETKSNLTWTRNTNKRIKKIEGK